MTVGQRLKQARRAANISGEELGKLIGVSKGQISNIEKDKSQLTKSNAIVLATHLGVAADWLINGDEDLSPKPGASTTSVNKSKSTGNTVTLGGYPNQGNAGASDLQAEIEKLRLENEYLKQRLKDKEEMIELLKRK